MSANTTDRIRMLNDELRQHLSSGGSAVMTPGVAALGSEAVQRLVQTIAIFDDFCTANDPHGEHDFGAFEFEGAPIMFKIDYYDKDLNFHSPILPIPLSPNGCSPLCWQMNISRPEDAPSVFLLDESAEGASNKVPGLIFEAMATLRLDFDGPLQGRSDSSI